MGRPSAYSDEIAKVICEKLADGKSLRSICNDDSMPSEATVRAWALDDYHGFSAHYTRARMIGFLSHADEILEISDTPQIGVKKKTTKDGIEITEGDMIEHRKLRVDSRKWVLSKMLPKIFGDKLAVGGADDLPPIKTEDMTPAERARRIVFALAKGLRDQPPPPADRPDDSE